MFPRPALLLARLGFGTLDPNSPSSNVTLSNGNLTGTNTVAGWASRRTIGALLVGKVYFEATFGPVASGSAEVGIVTAASDMTVFWGGDGHSYRLRSDGPLMDKTNTTQATLSPAPGNNGTMGVAGDFDAGLVWARTAPSGLWNSSGTANPATGVGGLPLGFAGPYYAAAALFSTSGVMTFNFGSSAFVATPPSGFSW